MNTPSTIEAEDFTALILNQGEEHAEHRARLAAIDAKFDAHAARIDELCDEWSECLGDACRPALSPSAEPLRVSSASPLRSLSQGEVA